MSPSAQRKNTTSALESVRAATFTAAPMSANMRAAPIISIAPRRRSLVRTGGW